MKINEKVLSHSHDFYRAGLLLQKAAELDMDLSGFGELALNEDTGNVYLWLENYPFSLFIALHSETVKACWRDSDTGDKVYTSVLNKSLDKLCKWTESLEQQSEANNA